MPADQLDPVRAMLTNEKIDKLDPDNHTDVPFWYQHTWDEVKSKYKNMATLDPRVKTLMTLVRTTAQATPSHTLPMKKALV
jgi:hypothetical protein